MRVALLQVMLIGGAVAAAAQDGSRAYGVGLAEKFKRLDRNGDEKVSREEGGTLPFFEAADTDGDGFLTFDEAEAHARRRAAPDRNRTAGMEGDGAGPMTSRVGPVVVPETESPVRTLDAKAADGRAARAFWRMPKGDGPFPAIVFIHGGLTQFREEVLRGQLKVNPVITRMLAAGYAVVQATFRTYEQDVQSRGPIEDVRAVVHALAKVPGVDAKRVALFGGSGGGSIALELGSDAAVRAVVAGEPATVLYTGMLTTGEYAPRLAIMAEPEKYFTPELRARTQEKLKALRAPVLILHSDQHDLRKLNAPLFLPLMKEAGVKVEYREYPGYGHGFYFGGGDDRWGKGADEAVVDALVRDVRVFLDEAMPAVALAAPLRFPDDGGVVDVTRPPYSATPDGASDNTRAIQAALDDHPNGNRIIYLPPGVWTVTDTLKWPDGAHGGHAQKRTILQGAGVGHTVLRMPAAVSGFGDAANPKALIWTGNRPAQRFRNAVRDLSIEVGPGNPGAIGLQFNASNQGTIRNVAIRAAEGSGAIGLDMGFTDEIGPLLVRDLAVEGFEVGIVTKWPVNSATFEHVTLRGQRRFGWWNYHQMIFVRGLKSENAVPAIYNEKDSWGTVTLLDSKLVGKGAEAKTPGILNQRQMYLRKVEISGYAKSVEHADKGRDKGDVAAAGLIREDTSHTNVVGLFREIAGGTFAGAGAVRHLPVKETPAVPWGEPSADWTNIVAFGADPEGRADASPALQAAIDSGARTVYLPGGARFRFAGEVQLRGPTARLIGLEGRFTAESGAVWRLVDGRHPRGLPDAPAVVIERCSGESGGAGVVIRHESARTLVVSSWTGAEIEGQGAGDLFLEDVCGRLELARPGQSAWCRQLNTECSGTMLRNNGGRLWILGMKTERIGTVIETVNGGFTDAAGILVYSNQGWDDRVPAFRIENAAAVLAGVNERNFNRRPVSLWFSETNGGETRERRSPAWVYLSR